MRRAVGAASLTLAALLASSCRRPDVAGGGAAAGSSGATALAADHVDLPRSYLFRPAAITVKAGTRVTWTNHDVFTHAVQLSEPGSTQLVMKPGDSVSLVLTATGTHAYICPFHPQMMKGSVVVTAN